MKRLCILLVCIMLALPSYQVSAADEPDHMTAFFLSFMVPGLGHWYAGSPGAAKLFIASEIAIWGGYYYTNHIRDSYSDDYLSFAILHAGVTPTDHGAAYLTAIGAYDSSFDYNRMQDQSASQPHYYEGPDAWDWDSYENRDHFKELRERELDFDNYAKYCVAGAVLNHFLAGLSASKLARQQAEAFSVVTVHPIAEGLAANYRWSF